MELLKQNILPVELEKSLQKSWNQEGKTHAEYQVSEGCKPGENCISEIFHLFVNSKKGKQTCTDNYILKLPPADRKFRDGCQAQKFMKNEVAFYSKVMPKLNEFLKSNQLPLPRYIFSFSDGENDVLVLEDLCAQGFEIEKKGNSLNVDEILITLKELGRFHAVSLALKELQPEMLTQAKSHLNETLFFEGGREQFKNSTSHKAAIRMLESRYPERRYDLVEKMQNFSDNFFDNMMDMVQTPTPLAVICHGGSWIKNIFFKYQQEKPAELRFVDFKIARFGSLAFDLSSLLYCSCEKVALDDHWDMILDSYLTAMNEALRTFGAIKTVISRKQIDEEMIKFGRFGVATALSAVPLLVTPLDKMPKFEGDLENYRDYQMNMHADLKVRDRVTDLIVHAVEKNMLV